MDRFIPVDKFKDNTLVLGLSGGKDSAATGLFMREMGLSYINAFCDTGWEHPATYRYIREVLPQKLGPIRWLRPVVRWHDTVRTQDGMSKEAAAELASRLETYALEFEHRLGVDYSAFVRLMLKKGGFPARVLRWCTSDLKTAPMAEFLANLDDPVNVVGIRHEESKARSQALRLEWDPGLDCEAWRPIIDWTLDDVIEIHKYHGLEPNPLYTANASRVGCYPCIFARKSEIATLSDRRVDILRDLESVIASLFEERIRRRGEEPSRIGPTFFQDDEKNDSGSYSIPIDEVMQWARTETVRDRKKRERFVASGALDGCMRWGRCDTGAAQDRS